MSEEEQIAIERLTRKANGETVFAIFYNQEQMDKDIQTVLNLIEKQQNKIKDVKIRLEYYLMGNLSFNKEAQKEFERLLKMLEE